MACGLEQEECVTKVSQERGGCLVSCTGLYADVQSLDGNLNITANSTQEGIRLLVSIFDKYNEHKNSYAKSLMFDPSSDSFSKFVLGIFYN